MTEDFYDLLDVPRDASQDEIKSAFREKVRVYHPDRNDDERARAQFTAVKKAYDILGDPVERRAYDRLGHEDYVAKRTSGLPSPDVWRTGDDGGTDSASTDTRSTGGASTASATTSGSTGSAAASSATSGGARSDGGASATANSTSRTRPSNSGRGATATGDGPFADSGLARWWRRRNLAGPLLWVATLTYLAGLLHFAAANAAALRGVRSAVVAAGTDPEALQSALVGARHGLATVDAYVGTAAPVTPPAALGAAQWYGLLGGVVAVACLALVGFRVAWRENPWGQVTIGEPVVLAAAVGTSALLAGGPLLAGVALLPLLFGVIVYRTRRLPGWSPSYAYVGAVCVPALALAASVGGFATLATDLLAFVVVPVVGGVGLPLRVAIRRRYGR